MKIYGTFKDYKGQQYQVRISDGYGSQITISDTLENGFDRDAETQIFFSKDPVHIQCKRSDLTQLIMISQATIKLWVNRDMSKELFANTNRDIHVLIRKKMGNTGLWCPIFFGYVDPLNFSQGFAHKYEEITITATDPLGALESMTIDQTEILQDEPQTALSMLTKIFDAALHNDERMSYLTDGGTVYGGLKTFFSSEINPSKIKINPSIFYGTDQEDRMTLYDVLSEILKYLGCTVSYSCNRQPGGNVGYVHLYNMYSQLGELSHRSQWFDGKDDSLDESTSLSMDDVYSQVTLTCEIEPVEEKIELINADMEYSDYGRYQKYMTELVAKGYGATPYEAFSQLLNSEDNNETTELEEGYRLEYYCQVTRNDAWSFGSNSYITAMGGTDGENITPMTGDQSDVLTWLYNNPLKGAFVQFGKGNKIVKTDNSLLNNVDMSSCFVISICGHNDHRADGGHNATMCNYINNNKPICTYTGMSSLNLIPADSSIINYIVITGKIVLNPLQPKTTPIIYSDLYDRSKMLYSEIKQIVNENEKGSIVALFNRTVPHDDDEDGVYYAQKWWSCSDPIDPEYTVRNAQGITAFLENKHNEALEYTYSAVGDASDKIKKLPILVCQLKIGNKYCVERLDEATEGEGKMEWMTEEEWEASPLKTAGYEFPFFTIGIDPAVGDKIVGHSFEISNNIDHSMNLGISGTAIPIKISDKLNGVPEFTIVGPINSMWNEIERIHPTLFRHTKWNDHKYWILEMLQSIQITDLTLEPRSNNGLFTEVATVEDNDLVYFSDTDPRYLEKLEENIKICTPLTLDECLEKGIKYQISNSYVMTAEDEPFYGWKMGDEVVKPEHLYVDYMYRQYCSPARILEINVDAGDVFGYAQDANNDYISTSTVVSKYIVNMEFPGIKNEDSNDDYFNYFVTSVDWSLKLRDTKMTMREMLDYDYPFNT